ncbi:MAG: DNA-directed RNA polymerase II subunit RPB1 [Stictis urceolatum]|nr:DNA-directed RNA polymerase II subunit RPB1 [Stictis urceolata]
MDIFATPPESTLEGLFDFNFDVFQSSSDDTYNDSSNFFDELSNGSAARDLTPFDLSPPVALSAPCNPSHLWRADSWRNHSVDAVPKSQRLVHKLRRDDIAISNSELLSLEGKLPKASTSAASSTAVPPSTPSNSPQQRSGPPSPRGAGRTHRAARPTNNVAARAENGSLKMMHPSSYFANQRSPSLEDGFQRINIRTPSTAQHFPSLGTGKPSLSKRQSIAVSEESCTPTSPQNGNFERFTANGAYTVDSNSYPEPSLTQSSPNLWTDKSSQDFPFSPSQPWEPSNTTKPNSFDEDFGAPQSTQPYNIDTSLASTGLGIQYDPFADPFPAGGGFVEPDISTSPAFDDNLSESSDISPSTTQARHFSNQSNGASPSISPSTPSTKRRRSSRPSKSPRTPRTPRTPKTPTKGGSMSGGFVNFTPDDSRKILGGVAPSGSSKTKARREREASERRRKLSEAAAKAVREAGGDVNELMREGLLLDHSREE